MWSYNELLVLWKTLECDLQLFLPNARISQVKVLNSKDSAFQTRTTPFNQSCRLLSRPLTISVVHTLQCFHTWILSCEAFSASHLKQHCSGDIKVMFRSVGRTTFQCLYWSLGEGILSERERGICRGLPSFFGHWGCSLCHSNLYIFPFIMQFYLKRDYNTLKEVFHINTVITYRPKTYILFSFGKLPSS